MLFNSFEFILAFLPTTVVVYFILNAQTKYTAAKISLLFACLFFYGWWNPNYILLILSSMIVNYFLGTQMPGSAFKKELMVTGIVFNLGLLVYYKYVNFFIDNLNRLPQIDITLMQVILPLGISFFTFQQIAYLVDSYQGHTKEYNPISYGVFVSFFPQLIAGPIVHHQQMMPQFTDPSLNRVNYHNLSKGLFIFLMGLAKKVIIADSFGIIANKGYGAAEALSTTQAWVTSLAYSLQLYFDFSGYSAMAIGLGLFFNIQLPINFNSPYKSRNIQEFWRRWHITLSRFLKDYVYIPLGGNQKSESRTLYNLGFTFLLGGIWHGAGWTFVIWGLLHGFALIIYRLWSKNGSFSMPNIVAIPLTFIFVNITWVFFRAPSWGTASTLLERMFIPSSGSAYFNLVNSMQDFPLWAVGIGLLFMPNSIQIGNRFKPTIKYALLIVKLIVLNMTFLNSVIEQDFLYFDF
jgi:D-alanyl-lipoteichoic acid acyltransferase DltB (MBOAT superfamily)